MYDVAENGGRCPEALCERGLTVSWLLKMAPLLLFFGLKLGMMMMMVMMVMVMMVMDIYKVQ